MVSVYLICVGKLKEKFYLDACQEYLKRLKGYCKLTLVEIPEAKLPQSPSLGRSPPPWIRRARPFGPSCPPWAP